MLLLLAAQLDNGGISSGEAVALLITAVSTFITAIGGFILIMRRQTQSEQSVTAKVDQVYSAVNGIGDPVAGEPKTIGQSVRKMNDDMAAIKRELGIKD